MVIIQVAQLILALTILVFIHELGHFLAARMFGVRVEKFYIFLMPGQKYGRLNGAIPNMVLVGYPWAVM